MKTQMRVLKTMHFQPHIRILGFYIQGMVLRKKCGQGCLKHIFFTSIIQKHQVKIFS